MDINKYASDQIKILRNRRNMTQEELAEALNIKRQTVARYENNQRQIKQNLLFKLSKIFNVPLSTFFPTIENQSDNSKTYTILNDEAVKIDIKLNDGYDLTPDIINKVLDELYKIKLEQKK